MILRQKSWNGRAGTTGLGFACAFAAGVAVGAVGLPGSGRPGTAAASARAADPASPPATIDAPASATSYRADVLEVVDGDTFVARVRIWPGLAVTTKVRLRGIDAPEMRSRCDREQALAVAARERLAAILAEGAVAIASVGLDKYGGRVLAVAATPRTADAGAALLAAGLARPYAGGRRESWCGLARD